MKKKKIMLKVAPSLEWWFVSGFKWIDRNIFWILNKYPGVYNKISRQSQYNFFHGGILAFLTFLLIFCYKYFCIAKIKSDITKYLLDSYKSKDAILIKYIISNVNNLNSLDNHKILYRIEKNPANKSEELLYFSHRI